jgi:hypothetical protein
MDASPTHDPAIDALRIQTAALVAQQSSLFDRELRVQQREADLAQQEVQLANHLEDQRRQLLELQDQITEARENLRSQRAAFQELAEQQGCEQKAARNQAADMLGEAKAKRAKLARLQRRLWDRWQRERQIHAASEAALAARRRQLDAEQSEWQAEVARHNGRVELDQRQLQDGWRRLNEERTAWRDRRAADMADLKRRLRDLALRDKAIAAAEARHKAEQSRRDRELTERRHEIEHLETRIGHARQRLLESQTEVFVSRPPAPTDDFVSRPQAPAAMNAENDARLLMLLQVAGELTDQRLWLCEQIGRLNQARHQWLSERDAAAAELDALGADLQNKDEKLSRRARDLTAAHQRAQAEAEALGQLRLRMEAERTQRAAELSAQKRELERQSASLAVHEERLTSREGQLNDVLRVWGRRRRVEIEKLRTAGDSCHAERVEWAAARDAWLRAYEQVVRERRDLATRALALEQVREDWRQSADGHALARKRLERLERNWITQFNADVRELDRLRDTIESEAARLDDLAERVRSDRLATIEQLAAAEEKARQLDAERLALRAERSQIAEAVESEQSQREAAETHVLGLRDEVENLARLLIDAPVPVNRAA